jgi:O-antigen/teichoic acid export membrane protein
LATPALIGILRDWGVNSAMIQFSAQYKAEGRTQEIRSIFVSGLIFEILLGLTLSAICFVLSDFLATTAFNRPDIAPLIKIASFTILATGIVNAATAAFTGVERMELNSIMLVCQSIIKTILVIALVFLGLGAYGATIGHTIGFAFAGLIGILLLWVLYRTLPKPVELNLEIKAYIKAMFKYGLPLSLSAIISGILTQFYAFLLPIHYVTDNSIIGNYGIAVNFVVLISFFATPITTMLFPAFSKLDPEKDKATLKNVFQFSVKYAAFIVVPVASLVMALAEPAVSTLFGATYQTAPLFLALTAISYLYTAFGSLSTGNLINSQGQTAVNLYFTVLLAAIGFPMGYILIMQFGVLGLILTMLTTGVLGVFISLAWTKKRYGVTIDWKSSAKILFSSLIAATITYAVINQLSFSNWIRLIIGVVIFVPTLIAATLLTKTINETDINNLREMISALGPLRSLLNRLLTLIEKIMIVIKHKQKQ